MIKSIHIRLYYWTPPNHFKDVWKYDSTAEILYLLVTVRPWTGLKKISKWTPRTGPLFTTVAPQDPPDNYISATEIWKNACTKNIEILSWTSGREKTNTLNNIFEDLDSTKVMKYSFYIREEEDILDATDTEGVIIVSGKLLSEV